MVRHALLRPVAVVLAVVCLFEGCYAWNTEPRSAPSLNQRQLASARVLTVDGRQLVMIQPRIVGDSLVGRIDSVVPGPASLTPITVSQRVAIALTGVRSVETRHVNGWKTAGLTLVSVVAVFAALAGLYAVTCNPEEFFCGR